MAQAISLRVAAKRYRRMSTRLKQWAGEATDELRVSILASQEANLRDAPNESMRRKKSDKGPLRIVTSELWWSLVGNTGLEKSTAVSRILPSTSRRYPPNISEAKAKGFEKKDVTATNDRIRVSLSFGTKTEYAAAHEFGESGPGNRVLPARPYFFPGVHTGFDNWRKSIIDKQTFRKRIIRILSGG